MTLFGVRHLQLNVPYSATGGRCIIKLAALPCERLGWCSGFR